MSKLPAVDGKTAIAIFESFGFVVDRVRGSHHTMKKPGHPENVVVAMHGSKPIPTGTLRSMIRAAGITVEDFKEAVQNH